MKQIVFCFLVAFTITTSMFSQSPVVQQILNSASQDSIIYFVRELSGDVSTIIGGTTQTIVSRHKLQPGNTLAETYIKQKLESHGLPTTVQSFSTTGKNVFAVQTGNEFPNQKYIICAHFDDMPSGSIAPGADDNASGTAAVIEAARIFSQYSFPFTIIYALWDEEEQGLIGSNYYATLAASSGDSILGVINLDMIAYDSNDDGVINIHSRPTAGNSVEIKDKMVECNTLYGINLTPVIYSPGSTYSDNASFWSQNYGAILLIEDDNDFNAYYHTVNDLIQYYNQPYYFKLAKLSFATLASFALNLNMNIIHTPIASTTQTDPITTSALISTGLDVGTGNLAPRLYYRTRPIGGTFGSFNAVIGTPTESENYGFTIPSLSLGTVVHYFLAAQDANSSIVTTLPAGGSGFNPPGSIPPPNFFQFFVADTVHVIVLNDEADNTNNWTSIGGWDITTAKYVSPPTSFTDSPGGGYSNNVTSSLQYNNQIDLTDVVGAILEFDTQWDIEIDWDYGQIQVSTNNGSTWTALEGLYTNPGVGNFQPNGEPLYDGTQLTWVHETIDISNYINHNISIRFLFRSDNYVTEDGWYVDNVKITTFEAIATFQFAVDIADGWNMVSIPGLHPTNQDVTTWWSGLVGNVFKFSSGYQVVTTAIPGEGYWMKNSGAQVYNTGDEWPAGGINIVPHDPIPALTGWNMIGGYENSAAVSGLTTTPSGLISGSVFGYSGGYQVATNLVPGYGYWIKLTGDGVINIPSGPLAKGSVEVVEQFKDDWGKITITDNAGRSYTLYAVTGEVNLDNYELPPAPPTGMFDIRYGSGRIAENINSSIQSIEMMGIEHPVRVKVENMSITLQDESGKEINAELEPGEEIIIYNNLINKLLVLSGELMAPIEYALEQNYPNPFNPNTTIKFVVPKESSVNLSIYNVLGELVSTVVNEQMKAGYYEYKFDASTLASGVYLYRLQAGSFVETKKMVLMK